MVVIVRKEKRSKYGNIKINCDGITFHSKKEAKRYKTLKLKEKAGLISNLQIHPKFSIEVNGEHICNYIADFSYYEENGKLVVEDTKGIDPKGRWDTRTETYKLKKRLMKAVNNIEIKEV